MFAYITSFSQPASSSSIIKYTGRQLNYILANKENLQQLILDSF